MALRSGGDLAADAWRGDLAANTRRGNLAWRADPRRGHLDKPPRQARGRPGRTDSIGIDIAGDSQAEDLALSVPLQLSRYLYIHSLLCYYFSF